MKNILRIFFGLLGVSLSQNDNAALAAEPSISILPNRVSHFSVSGVHPETIKNLKDLYGSGAIFTSKEQFIIDLRPLAVEIADKTVSSGEGTLSDDGNFWIANDDFYQLLQQSGVLPVAEWESRKEISVGNLLYKFDPTLSAEQARIALNPFFPN